MMRSRIVCVKEHLLEDLQLVFFPPTGGIIQMADLEKYHVQIRAPISSKLSDSTLFGVGLPSGNVIFHFILDILEGYTSLVP